MEPNELSKAFKKLESINNKIESLYGMRRKLTIKLFKKIGTSELIHELDEPTEDGHKFVRYKLIDNMDVFKTGKPLYKASPIERYGFECRYLKNKPKK